MALNTYIATWESMDNPEMNFSMEVVAANTKEAWDTVWVNARISMGTELNRWTLVKMERVTPSGRERVA